MTFLRGLLWLLVLFPWLDLGIRMILPGALSGLWDEVFLISIILAVYLFKGHENRLTVIPLNIRWAFYALLLFSVGSIVVNAVPLAVSIDALRVMYQPMLFILLTMYLLDDERLLDRFMQLMVVSAVLIALWGMIEYIFRIENTRWNHAKDRYQFRIVSIFSNPNALAGYLNMMLAFTGAFVLFLKDKKLRLLYLAASLPILAALLLTFSRGAWIGLLLMGIMYIWFWNKKWLLALPILGGLSPFILPSNVLNRIKALFDPEYYRMSSEYGRISFWTEAYNRMMDNPLFGVGMGSFGDSVAWRHNMPFATWVDNHYLKIGAEIGLLGLFAFLFLLGALFYLAYRGFKQAEGDKERAYFMGICGVLVVMVTQNVTASIWEALNTGVYYYSFIGLLFALLWKRKKKGASLS
jgi:O-antigen ligase